MKKLTTTTFNSEVLNSDKPWVVMFTSKSCNPCKALKPVLRDLAITYKGHVHFGEVDIQENTPLMNRYATYTVPTLLIFDGGIVADHMAGMPGKAPSKMIAGLIDKILARRDKK